jgi:hypothetical protein
MAKGKQLEKIVKKQEGFFEKKTPEGRQVNGTKRNSSWAPWIFTGRSERTIDEQAVSTRDGTAVNDYWRNAVTGRRNENVIGNKK